MMSAKMLEVSLSGVKTMRAPSRKDCVVNGQMVKPSNT